MSAGSAGSAEGIARAVDAWVATRRADLLAREYDNALITVGGDRKPLGAQGFGFDLAGKALATQAGRAAAGRGLKVTVDAPHAGRIGWWVYAWDEAALDRLLAARWPGLPSATRLFWPRPPARFIAAMRKRKATPQTALYDLIADCYGDKTGPGRTDVLPGVDRGRLLDAYRQAVGKADPTVLYFGRAPRAPLGSGPWVEGS